MLTQVEEGKIYLEDEDAHIELNMNAAVSPLKWGAYESKDLILSFPDIRLWLIYRWIICISGRFIYR